MGDRCSLPQTHTMALLLTDGANEKGNGHTFRRHGASDWAT